ncbi:MAG: hypothetical protein NVSMB44_30220 [Ktedonobacteraceae bacterium]
MQLAQSDNIRRLLVRIVETVVGFGEPFLPREHDGLAMAVVALADVFEAGCIGGEGEGLEAVGGRVVEPTFQAG